VKKLILIGAGGQAKSCIDVIQSSKNFKILGIINSQSKKKFLNIKILGKDKYLTKLKNKKQINLHIAIGFIKNPIIKIKLYEKFKKMGFIFPVIKAKSSIVSKNAIVLDGTILHHKTIINSDAKIGYNSIINTATLIEHDVKIGNNCHISTGVILNGNVIVGDNTFVGSGVKVKNGVTIGKNCIIGMGVIIKKNIRDNSIIKN
tara:strand:- start:23 stop:631 length:609 start_codon:yes stop_codon:yes gene_type:complete